VNEEWIGDKSRFIWDGLRRQRLDQPYIRRGSVLEPASWAEAFAVIAERMARTAPARIAAIVGDLAAAEEIKALKDLMGLLGSPHLDCRQDGAKLQAIPRQSYLFNSTIAGIDAANAILLVGINPRWEAPVLNARIRKAWINDEVKIANIGEAYDLTYPVEQLGASPSALQDIATGAHPFAQVLRDAARPMVIVGQGALARPDGAAILSLAAKIARDTGMIGPEGTPAEGGWNGFNVLHAAASRVAALDLGCVPGPGGRDVEAILEGASQGEIEFVYLLGADEIDISRLGKAFVVYQGTHGDEGAHRADVVLPGAAFTEKSGLYVNTEGRVQLARRATYPPGDAKEDWAILRALSEILGKKLPYDDLDALRASLIAEAPHFARADVAPAHPGADPSLWHAIGAVEAVDAALPLKSGIDDYYLTNPIARASETMAECSRLLVRRVAMAAE
jgi:NADH-quinone oxidoreductase subunit G